ncbi:MAG TPA: hypothetical protein VL095_07510, partial [Flavisolibacter sp.]|nr:hypothetical protein [Flavisolibacter sp.]
PILRIAKESFCNNDRTEFVITATPADGILEGEGVKRRADGNFVFVPAGLSAGSYVIKYILNEKSASVTVTVNATPTAKFTTVKSIGDGVMKVEIRNESTGTTDQAVYEWLLDDQRMSDKKDPDPLTFKLQTLPHTLVLRVTNTGCSGEFKEVIELETVTKSIQVCSNVKKQPLETDLPAGANIVILKNEGGIINNDLIMLPSSMNVTKTTDFNVSYAVNGKQIDAVITVVFANANFSMELSRVVGTSALITTLSLKSLDPTITKSEWQIKQGNNVVTETGKAVVIQMEGSRFVLGRVIDITHSVEVSAASESCGQKATFKLTGPVVDKQLNKGPFNNDFTIE